MDKEIPNSNPGRGGRLREAAARLTERPLDTPLDRGLWDEITGDLPGDPEPALAALATSARARARLAAADHDRVEAVAAATEAVLLRPFDPGWAAEIDAEVAGWAPAPEYRAWRLALKRRRQRRPGRRETRRRPGLRGLVVVGAFLLTAALVVTGVLLWGPDWTLAPPLARVQGPRTLPASFDTQGIRADIEVVHSRLVVYPESTVVEIAAWVVFPEHRVEVWEGTVTAVDARGAPLARRDVVFHAAEAAPLEAGQGFDLWEQFDAWPWFDRVQGFQVSTRQLVARPQTRLEKTELAWEGRDRLTAGQNLRVWQLQAAWSDRFASRAHTLGLEVENSGLKPLQALVWRLEWRDGEGRTLKTQVLRPVSEFRGALPPGARIPWTQETVFDTEVFSWAPGADPHFVLILDEVK